MIESPLPPYTGLRCPPYSIAPIDGMRETEDRLGVSVYFY